MFRRLIPIIICCLIIACASDKKVEESSSVLGSWVLEQAFRNGNMTTTLEGAYFKFTQDSIATNLLGRDMTDPCIIKEDKIMQISQTAGQIEYRIVSNDGTKLRLNTTLRGIPFEFTLKKEN